MDLETIILSEISQAEKYHMISPQNDANELIYNIDSQKTNLWLPRGKGCRELLNRSLRLADTNYYIYNR